MSAAAAKSAAAELPKVRRLPAWTRRNIAWRALPETYFTVLLHELSPAAFALAGLMLCLAGEEEHCDATQAKLAKMLKVHLVTVQEALDELERAGAIAKRKEGARKVYDLLVDNWKNVRSKPRPKVEEMPAAEEADTIEAPAAAAPRKPLQSVSIARGKARDIAIPPAITCRAVRCANESAFPLDVEARIIAGEQGADLIELAIREKSAISQHAPDANKGVNPERPSEKTGCLDELFALRDMLNRALGAHLGFVPDHDLAAIGTALNGCPIDHLARRVHQRRSMLTGGKGTWGGVLLLARDCAKAFAAASVPQTVQPAPASEPVSATIARQEEYEAHCEQLFAAWWEAQTAQERAKLAKRHTGVILAQFAGAQFWPAAQLAESVHAAIRAEALKTIAPSFREFAAASTKAKGASA